MDEAPREIDGAKVLFYTPIDARHQPTGNCRQIVGGELMGASAGLAICRYDGENNYYLFGCDEHWNTVTDTWHETLEDAKTQAEFEYMGVNATWRQAPD